MLPREPLFISVPSLASLDQGRECSENGDVLSSLQGQIGNSVKGRRRQAPALHPAAASNQRQACVTSLHLGRAFGLGRSFLRHRDGGSGHGRHHHVAETAAPHSVDPGRSPALRPAGGKAGPHTPRAAWYGSRGPQHSDHRSAAHTPIRLCRVPRRRGLFAARQTVPPSLGYCCPTHPSWLRSGGGFFVAA